MCRTGQGLSWDLGEGLEGRACHGPKMAVGVGPCSLKSRVTAEAPSCTSLIGIRVAAFVRVGPLPHWQTFPLLTWYLSFGEKAASWAFWGGGARG